MILDASTPLHDDLLISRGGSRPRFDTWMAEHLGVPGPFTVRLIAGGRSNLTFEVRDATGARWAVRRPPHGELLATAHDVAREHRLLAALFGSAVPVPEPLALCTDPEVAGAPLLVMGYVEGQVVREEEDAAALGLATRRATAEGLIDVLAALHDVDVVAVGLGDLARHDGYIERQLRRWWGQYEISAAKGVDPLMAEVHRALAASVPEQRGVSIVHGDYRLQNTILGPDGEVRAVLDWELCTLGDALADLGVFLVYWAGEGEVPPSPAAAATAQAGFPTRAELADRYARASGRDISEVDFYVAFAAWKIASIMQGVLARYSEGNRGGEAADVPTIEGDRRALTLFAAATLGLA